MKNWQVNRLIDGEYRWVPLTQAGIDPARHRHEAQGAGSDHRRPGVVVKTNDRPADIARIVLVAKDGTEERIEVSENSHVILGFAKCGPDGGKGVPMDIIVMGTDVVVGEILFRITKTVEALRNAPVAGGVQ